MLRRRLCPRRPAWPALVLLAGTCLAAVPATAAGPSSPITFAPSTISGIVVNRPGVAGLPKLDKLMVLKSNQILLSSLNLSEQKANDYDRLMPVPPGVYDVVWVPSSDSALPVRIARGILVQMNQMARLRLEGLVGGIVVRRPGYGVDLSELWILKAGSSPGLLMRTEHPLVQRCRNFDEAMIVPAGVYDVWLNPAKGDPVPIQRRVVVKAGNYSLVGQPPR